MKLEQGQGAILVAFRRPSAMTAGKFGALSIGRYDPEAPDLVFLHGPDMLRERKALLPLRPELTRPNKQLRPSRPTDSDDRAAYFAAEARLVLEVPLPLIEASALASRP